MNLKEFEDIKEVIRIRKSKKDRQHNGIVQYNSRVIKSIAILMTNFKKKKDMCNFYFYK